MTTINRGLLLAAWLVFVGSTAATNSEGRPLNIVLILTDNQGAWTLGCYGNPDIQTPNIDRLARGNAIRALL